MSFIAEKKRHNAKIMGFTKTHDYDHKNETPKFKDIFFATTIFQFKKHQ